MLFMAATHMHARMLKHKNSPSTLSQNRNSLEIHAWILCIQKCLMQHMQNATIAGSAILNMAYEMLQLTCIQFWNWNTNAVSMMRRARCMQNRWMNANMLSYCMLIETCPNLTIISRYIKGKKDVGLEDIHHTHAHLLQYCPRTEGPNKYTVLGK